MMDSVIRKWRPFGAVMKRLETEKYQKYSICRNMKSERALPVRLGYKLSNELFRRGRRAGESVRQCFA